MANAALGRVKHLPLVRAQVGPFRVSLELGGDIATHRINPESLFAGVGDQRIDQLRSDTPTSDLRGYQGMFGRADITFHHPGQSADCALAFNVRLVLANLVRTVAGYSHFGHVTFLMLDGAACRHMAQDMAMQFLSDNAASVHPALWRAMQAADAPDSPYDGDAMSRRLDAAFGEVFGRDCAVLWTATGTSANCLALATMVQPHGGVVCHREAHIEVDEGGAPGFYLHGAKLMLAEGEGAKLTPQAISAVIDPLRNDVHQVQPHAASITQASEYGRAYRPAEIAAIAGFCAGRGLPLHVDGARFGNAVAFLGCTPWEACQGAAALSFGMIKNGGMSAEALVFFDRGLADVARYRRKRAGHLQSKGRYLAAQLLAMLEGDLWLENARHANAAAQELAAAAGDRLLHPVEANEVFLRLTGVEREALRAQGFSFYDWGEEAARLVTAWNSPMEHVTVLARAIAAL